jgi:hypothetical protein
VTSAALLPFVCLPTPALRQILSERSLLSPRKRPVANERIARGLGRLRPTSKRMNETQETQTL